MIEQLSFEEYQEGLPVEQEQLAPEDFETEMDRISALPLDEWVKLFKVAKASWAGGAKIAFDF